MTLAQRRNSKSRTASEACPPSRPLTGAAAHCRKGIFSGTASVPHSDVGWDATSRGRPEMFIRVGRRSAYSPLHAGLHDGALEAATAGGISNEQRDRGDRQTGDPGGWPAVNSCARMRHL